FGTLTVSNSTIAANSASTVGGGIDAIAGTVTVHNTLIATNMAPTGPDVSGNLTSQGHNLIGNDSGASGFLADLRNMSARLGPLQDNGGLTFTIALLRGSPAIDAGDN